MCIDFPIGGQIVPKALLRDRRAIGFESNHRSIIKSDYFFYSVPLVSSGRNLFEDRL